MKKTDRMQERRRINYLFTETDALYHQASLKMGISDSVSIVLYTIYDKGDACLLSDVYKSSGISKQTVNSAIRKLEADGTLYLEPYVGHIKRIVLTEKGQICLKNTAAKLFEAEIRAFDGWTEDEVNSYIQLTEKYTESLRREIQRL